MARGERRQSILTAARAEFAEHGYAGARVARIAERARVNKQLLFYYFGSKAGLHGAVARLDRPVGPGAGPRPGRPPPERLRAALANVVHELESRAELASLLVDPQASADGAAAARAYVERVIGELAAVFSEGQGMGYFRDDLDPAFIARQALALVGGPFTLKGLGDGTPDLHRRWSGGAADLLLRAAAW